MEVPKTAIRAAVLDLYNNKPNLGIGAIKHLLTTANGRYFGVPFTFEVFATRSEGEVPDLDYDVYISSGGPGSPFDGEGKPWETRYFNWLDAVWNHNARSSADKKHVLFICHSFQMMCRFFEVAEVIQRRSESFGVMEVHPTLAGKADPLFAGLGDPFYAADFRRWQVIQPDTKRLGEMGAEILALEKKRPHVDLERALMAIRLTPELAGTQFHPEADPPGMSTHFRKPERRAEIIKLHGEEKYDRILHRLEDPSYLNRTYEAVVPNFLAEAVAALRPEQVTVAA